MSVGRAEIDRLVREAIDRSELGVRVKRLETQLAGLRFVAGLVASTGAVTAGAGFSISKGAAGLYSITFAPSFAAGSTPEIAITCLTAADRVGSVDSGVGWGPTGGRLFIVDTSAGTLVDTSFFFIATGGM